MSEFTDTERLDCLLRVNPKEISQNKDDCSIVFWLGSSSADERGFSSPGHYLAKGRTVRDCIDNILDNNIVFIN